jgi:tRNA A37 N6-isopentenylltransferase MiaA
VCDESLFILSAGWTKAAPRRRAAWRSSLKESMMKEIREMMEAQHREEIDKARSAGYLELVAEMERNYQGDRIFSDQFN